MSADVRRKAVRRGAVLVAVAALLGTATVLAITGTREPADALKLLNGTAWLGNSKVGSASEVNGYGGKLEGQAPAAHPGDPFQIIQRPDGAYVLDLKTGRLTKISNATQTTTASTQLAGTPSALQVLTSSGVTWVLDQSSGVLQQVDPDSLKPEGPSIPLGASTGVAVLDGDGNPWIPVPSKAEVVEVTAGGLVPHPVGQAGDQVALEVTSAGVWAVDGQAGRALSLTSANQALQIPQTSAGAAPVAASAPSSPYLAVLEGDQLLDLDTSRVGQSSTSSPAFTGTSQMSVVDDAAYLLDVGSTQLQTVNLDPVAQGPPISIPSGSDQLVTKDGLLFVNNVSGPQAAVVTPGGGVTPVAKYTPSTAPTSPDANPGAIASAANPLPLPAPSGPTGGQSGTTGGFSSAPVGAGGSGSSGSTPTGATVPPPTPTPSPSPSPTAPVSPQAPTAPTLNPVSASGPTLSASWTAPASTGTSAISSYKLVVTPQGAGRTPTPVTTSGQTTSGQVSGLTANSTYCAQVQAVNSAGAGPLSNQECAKTSTDVPGAPGTPSVKLQSTVSGGKQGATITWSAPSDLGPYNTPIQSYEVTADPSSGSAVTGTSSSTSISLELSTGTRYTVTVKAVNASGNASPDSPKSGSVATDTTPGKVSSLTAQAYDQEIDVTFGDANSGNNNQTTSYRVEIGGTTKKVSSGSSPVQFTGLTAGHSYTVTVTPYDAAGDGTAATASATPWGRGTIYYCLSDAQWGNYKFAAIDPNCENQAGYGVSTHDSPASASDYWVTAGMAQPKGSKMLYSGVIGTTVAGGAPQDSHYYSFTQGATPSGWSGAGAHSDLAWVFTSASAAGPGSTEMCEVLHSSSTHPYYDIVPASGASCLSGTTFYT